MEELAPICIRSVRIKTDLEDIIRENVRYYNIIVRECPPYIPNEHIKNGYIRAAPITRMNKYGGHMTNLAWPDHPKDIFGDHMGAIIVLNSLDNKILILRNEHLWGLPKGVRNFSEFYKIKTEFTALFEKSGGKSEKYFEDSVVFENIESGEENICRETFEETGIELDPHNLIRWDNTNYSAYTKYYYQLDFTAEEYGCILLKNGTDHENDELKWIDYAELNNMLQQHKTNIKSKVFNHVTYKFLLQFQSTIIC
jgi:8-oxo-dGTP pyrophosphatase MutT (NUDIX family)